VAIKSNKRYKKIYSYSHWRFGRLLRASREVSLISLLSRNNRVTFPSPLNPLGSIPLMEFLDKYLFASYPPIDTNTIYQYKSIYIHYTIEVKVKCNKVNKCASNITASLTCDWIRKLLYSFVK
jgi:hypothetical protein